MAKDTGMSIVLRPYQQAAIDTVMAAMREERFVLLQAATGAGKTIVFCELIKRLLSRYHMRIAVLAHRRELIIQAADKMKRVWPDAPIGLACSGVSSGVNVEAPVVIGSIQTLASRLGETSPFHLVVIDEAHRLPPRNKPSQYRDFLEKMEGWFGDLRVLGVTATPYRLGVGYIYGEKHKPGLEPWFNDLHFRIGIRELQDQGYLCGIRAKEAENIDSELAGIRTTGGEYNLAELSELMSKEIHVGSAVKAYEQYGEDRRHVVVFCVTIEHAEKVNEAFRLAGYSTGCVHSEMSLDERDRILAAYESGEIRILTNVGVLQEGWDSPQTDCILLCRPTKSSALYVQQIGRALRIHPKKVDMLILDLSGNIHRHGDPDHPNVIVPGANGRKPTESSVVKTCPNCKTLIHISAQECLECGYVWPDAVIERNDEVKLVDVQFKKPEGRWLQVKSIEPEAYVSRAGNAMLRVRVAGYEGGRMLMTVHDYWDIEGNASMYGKTKAQMKWRILGGDEPPPGTITEAMERWDELATPDEVKVVQDGKYLKVERW